MLGEPTRANQCTKSLKWFGAFLCEAKGRVEMEQQTPTLSIQNIANIILEKYPDGKNKKGVMHPKICILKKMITENDPILPNYVDYCTNYMDRFLKQNGNMAFLADDLLSIAIMLKQSQGSIEELESSKVDCYITIIRDKSWYEIENLNKIILNQDTMEELQSIRFSFETETEYLNYVNSILATALFRLRDARKMGSPTETIIEQLQDDLSETIKNYQNNPNQIGLLRVHRLSKKNRQPVQL